MLAAAEEVVRPVHAAAAVDGPQSIVQGYAGVYSSFLLHAERAAERYGVPPTRSSSGSARPGYVGGQEDMIIDIALQLREERELREEACRDTTAYRAEPPIKRTLRRFTVIYTAVSVTRGKPFWTVRSLS